MNIDELIQLQESNYKKLESRHKRLVENSYGIFCMAMSINDNDMELDIWWDKATRLYNEFVNSKFNKYDKSELDCINDFVSTKKTNNEL
jgi:hypothetical protein